MKSVWTYPNGAAEIKLEQHGGRKHLFRVTYGLQISDQLTYAAAAKELGACLLHAFCCEGLATNEGE